MTLDRSSSRNAAVKRITHAVSLNLVCRSGGLSVELPLLETGVSTFRHVLNVRYWRV